MPEKELSVSVILSDLPEVKKVIVELSNLLTDLVGDFPAGVESNALEAVREYLAQH